MCPRELPALRGLLIGDGPVAPDVRSRVGESGLAERVRMPGFRADARRLVQCMELFVLSSFSEGTSMALLEAMAAGVPVAVTRVGGNPEVVLDGETGWVVPSGSVEALTGAILESARDAGKRTRFGAAGRDRFEARFAFDRMIDGYRQRYREMTGATH